MKQRFIAQTSSICPACKNTVAAVIYEYDSSVYMIKHCSQHGEFKALISKHAWYYEGLNHFYDKIANPKYRFCENHSIDYQLFPRIHSNLEYDIFFSNGIDKTSDLSLEEIKSHIKRLRFPGKIIMLGGEPTERSDLPEIIKIISHHGHIPWLYTNGCRLDDMSYARKIKQAGVRFIFLWVDTLTDDSVYEKIRGRQFLACKKQVLQNLQTLHLPTGIIMTIIKGVNECHISKLLDFVCEHRFIRSVVMKSCSYIGRKKFPQHAELPIDELVETVAGQTHSMSLKEFYIFQKLIYVLLCFTKTPLCYLKQLIYLPRNKQQKISDIINFSRLELFLNRFSALYQESQLKAKAYFIKEIAKDCVNSPLLLALLGWKRFPWCGKYFFRLDFSGYYTALTYDKGKIKTRCNDIWLPSLERSEPVDFCRTLIESFKV